MPVAAPPPPPTAADVVQEILDLDRKRARLHAILDRRDMLNRIRDTLLDGSDAALFDLLQVPQHELPEAQLALRRALEMIASDPAHASDENAQFHREFLEFGIDALHRLSDYRAVPANTVTKYDIDREGELIGYGSFGRVFKYVFSVFGRPTFSSIFSAGELGAPRSSPSRCSLRKRPARLSSARSTYGMSIIDQNRWRSLTPISTGSS